MQFCRRSWHFNVACDEGIAICTLASLLDAVPLGELLIAKIDIDRVEADLFSPNCDWIRTAALIFIEPYD